MNPFGRWIAVIMVCAGLVGCFGAFRAGKSAPKQAEKAPPAPKSDEAPKQERAEASAKPQPKYDPPTSSPVDKLVDQGVDSRERAEVNQAALDFAQKNVPGVKHIKTCYSKLYGGWYLLLYVERGKKLGMQHWSWNAKSKEWEPVIRDEEISAKQLNFDLKGELAGEKCFILK